MKDSLFLDPGRRKSDFAFDEGVAQVFDDMIKRSVPFYFEIQNMIADLANTFAVNNSTIYDLGCSTGTTIALLNKRLKLDNIKYVGVDNSQAMLVQAEKMFKQLALSNVELRQADLSQGIKIENSNIVIMNLVLQFLAIEERPKLVKNVFNDLAPSGCFILVEKVTSDDPELNNIYIDKYHEFKKRNLYTDEEITRKRESLENILQPFSVNQNIELLKEAGFGVVDLFFRWFNFCGLIAIKH